MLPKRWMFRYLTWSASLRPIMCRRQGKDIDALSPLKNVSVEGTHLNKEGGMVIDDL